MGGERNPQAVAPASADSAKYTQPPRLLMLGDSITQRGWTVGGTGAALQDAYVRRLCVAPPWAALTALVTSSTVASAGRRGTMHYADDAGYNSIWALLAARQFLPAERDIRLATIFLGANDSVLEFRGQYVPLEDFKAKLREIYDLIRSVNAKAPPAVVFITCPPVSIPMRKVDVLRRWGEVPMDRDTERTRTYAHAAAEVAAELGAPCCELHDSMEAAALELGNGDRDAGLANFLDDGLHLSPNGYTFLTERLLGVIRAQLPDLAPERLPMWLAPWDQIDPKHPETAFPPPH